MIDIATDLKERFFYGAVWFHERYQGTYGLESDVAMSDKDTKAVEL